MAIIVSQSLASSSPLDQSAVKAVGLGYPLTKGSTGYFSQTFTTAEAIKNDLANLLLTKRGERPMVPEFGSDLHQVVFENNVQELQAVVDEIVRNAVSQWMPAVQIQDVRIIRENEDINIYILRISITYYVPNIVGSTLLTLTVE